MKAFLKTLLHTVGGAALAGGLGVLGGKSGAVKLGLAVLGSAISSAISALTKSTLQKQ